MGEIDKIKIENDTFALKRDYKYALETLTITKKEVADLIEIKDKLVKDIDDKQEDLKKVLNDISKEQLDWSQHRHTELKELEDKKEDINSILSRSADLDKQEEKIKCTLAENTKILNNNQQLEIKLQRDNISLDVKLREIEDERKILEKEKKDFAIVKQNFKDKLTELVQIYG